MNGEQLGWSLHQKYVGVTVDMFNYSEWQSQVDSACKKINNATGTYYSLSRKLGHTPQLYSLNHFKMFIRPAYDYASEVLVDITKGRRANFDKLLKSFLRRILHLPSNSLIPPLFIETGLDDVLTRWLRLTCGFMASAQSLPDKHPARLAIDDSWRLYTRGRGVVYRLMRQLNNVSEQWFPMPREKFDFTKQWAESTSVSLNICLQDTLKAIMDARPSAPYYTNVRHDHKPQAYLKHPHEKGRLALTLFRTGHSNLRYRKSLWDRREEGEERDKSCRYCGHHTEDELHVFFDCGDHNVFLTLFEFQCQLDLMRHEGIIEWVAIPEPGVPLDPVTPEHLRGLLNNKQPRVINLMARTAARINKLFGPCDPRSKYWLA